MMQTTAYPTPSDNSEAQAILDSIQGSNNNVFEYNIWYFENQRSGSVRLDFNDLLNLEEKYPKWKSSNTVDWVQVTKRIWLSLASSTTPNGYTRRLVGIKLFLTAMATNCMTQLSRDHITDILSFLLMYSWRNGGPSLNRNIKSYVTFTAQFQLSSLKAAMEDLSLNWIDRDVTESFSKKKLKQLIPVLSDDELTYHDWREGDSFNLLTLDHGRYYIEHCSHFFEKYYPLALALASTFQSAPELAASLGYSERTVSFNLPLILQGFSAENIKQRRPSWSITCLKRVHESVTQHFINSYRQAQFEAELLQDESLKNFTDHLGLKTSAANIDRMRVILWGWLHRKDVAETQHLLSEFHPKIQLPAFENHLNSLMKYQYQQLSPIPSDKDYRAIGLVKGREKSSSESYPRQLINLVTKAGLTNVIALTGWRKSEFGFPFSAVKRTRNDDKLDQYAFPWRYQIDWYVYKTNGRVRQLREVTFNTVLLIERLNDLVGASKDQPCLYTTTKENKNVFNSVPKVSKAVRSLWGHFVGHYSGFKLLDDWNEWQKLQQEDNIGKSLTTKDQHRLKSLLKQRTEEEWAHLSIDVNLKDAWRRAREEWPRLQFFLSGNTIKDKRNWLVNYRNGTLRSDWKALLDTHLKDDMKDWINSLQINELRDKDISKTITNSLVEGTLYPSAHSFRHMWAEAVYRRFDGDAGWMIRSQFKHISRTMWLAYIRDKDNRHSHQQVKAQVISSLVHNYLDHQGEGYAGQLHTWLRRLFRKTSVLSPLEQKQLAERLAKVEIENIKANPWGYCLLKHRTRNKAKCAEMGEPMRHNASPDLCLGCIHNLMQTNNVEWSLIHVAPHVEALKNPVVPPIFKASSFDLVNNVMRHVRTLNPRHEALPELQSAIDSYKLSRAF